MSLTFCFYLSIHYLIYTYVSSSLKLTRVYRIDLPIGRFKINN